VNDAAGVSGNADVTFERTIPWLQDAGDRVHASWEPIYRDVVILDPQNRKVAVFNLTVHDLQKPDEYDALKALLLDLAGE